MIEWVNIRHLSRQNHRFAQNHGDIYLLLIDRFGLVLLVVAISGRLIMFNDLSNFFFRIISWLRQINFADIIHKTNHRPVKIKIIVLIPSDQVVADKIIAIFNFSGIFDSLSDLD